MAFLKRKTIWSRMKDFDGQMRHRMFAVCFARVMETYLLLTITITNWDDVSTSRLTLAKHRTVQTHTHTYLHLWCSPAPQIQCSLMLSQTWFSFSLNPTHVFLLSLVLQQVGFVPSLFLLIPSRFHLWLQSATCNAAQAKRIVSGCYMRLIYKGWVYTNDIAH